MWVKNRCLTSLSCRTVSTRLCSGSCFAFPNERRMPYRFSMCDLLNVINPDVLKMEFVDVSTLWMWYSLIKLSYKKWPSDEVRSVFPLCFRKLRVEKQLCWGWAWLAAVPQSCVPRILSPTTSVPATGKEKETGPKNQRGAVSTPGRREREREKNVLQ